MMETHENQSVGEIFFCVFTDALMAKSNLLLAATISPHLIASERPHDVFRFELFFLLLEQLWK